jgi:hypothetical protein
MRTPEQIRANAQSIFNLIHQIDNQVKLIENEYQPNAIEMTGSRCDTFDEMLTNLKSARQSLNALMHMEVDYASDLENPDNE